PARPRWGVNREVNRQGRREDFEKLSEMPVMLERQTAPSNVTRGESRAAQIADVSVCIVSWNVKDLLRDCLNSLQANAGEVSYETIVVDNESSDGSAQMVREEFPWV